MCLLVRKQEQILCLVWMIVFLGGKEGGFYVSYGSLSVSFRFLRFCAAYLPVE